MVRAKRRTGLDPLAYLGDEPSSPFEGVIDDREPTENDYANFNIGTIWIDRAPDPEQVFILVSKSANVATWLRIGFGTSTTSFLTDAGTAVPVAGVITMAGGTNLNTSGAGSTVTFNVDNAPTFTGLITGDAGLSITAGTTTIISDTNAGNAIELRADGGPLEDMLIQSVQGTSIAAISIVASAGGIQLGAGRVIRLNAVEASEFALRLDAFNGGINAESVEFNVTTTQNASQPIYLHADGGPLETIRIHSDQGTSSTSINLESDVGGIRLTSGLDAANSIALLTSAGTSEQIKLQSLLGTSATSIDLESTVGGIRLLSGLNSVESILLNADAGINEQIRLESTQGTASDSISLLSTNGGIEINANAGNISLVPDTDSVAGLSLTLDAKIGVTTFTGQTTASGAQETFTITNSEVSVGSGISVTVSNGGANDARMTMERVTTAAGSFTVQTQNNGAAALNGDVVISFIVFN